MKRHITDEPDFYKAVKDYFYFIDRKYPEKLCVKIVGDHYRLSGAARNALFRGITSGENAEKREKKLTSAIQGEELFIDGYNVIFTIMNYRDGKPVFICNDGFLRDSGGQHGKIRNENIFNEAILAITEFLVKMQPAKITVYLDNPVSHSEEHSQFIEKNLRNANLPASCELVKSADEPVKQIKKGIIASSDSAVIDASHVKVADLARQVIETNYNSRFFNFAEIFDRE
ncbi:MAG: DUF434 domain-containing protein [Bacteroidia bacterium]|nr:DUF434 domain-containing protein [Bacteroidia bacterium]